MSIGSSANSGKPISRDPLNDYQRIEAAIEYLRANAKQQPSLAELSQAIHLSEYHLQRLFARWAGISPKRFIQLLTLEHAKSQLARSADLLTASYEAGLSGPGRLHDLFVTIEAVTPGEFKARGESLEIRYGLHPTPFGECLIGTTKRGVCFLEFLTHESAASLLSKLQQRWPAAVLRADQAGTALTMQAIFNSSKRSANSLHLFLQGTNFQIQVWRALLRIPPGHVCSYADVAQWIDRPKAGRAVGSAIGANPIAWLIPCHRVLRSDGQLGGYHWGETRKQACLAWEAGQKA
ncbi:methylated-DNA--[protein]-cysteine S-methyltransferase [Coraliomargarita sp. SDUM461003]|uniref:Methylated-DNA--[protein]-cysteine S-methyltransferase n=1 Tax=Thalassobacterium maritimum TaxID=3041265 RepID=A0ABU1ARE5_9BACT|nr:methylated-DNA--[protein]-cysteine S-methyltransferase [Coraliomargarita sp. SDUM461003]MDQ8206661.1 methylated-DNA--[protein]-cysteine S-methyltransferase [Coraliomargarita sp. SDUM461003]